MRTWHDASPRASPRRTNLRPLRAGARRPPWPGPVPRQRRGRGRARRRALRRVRSNGCGDRPTVSAGGIGATGKRLMPTRSCGARTIEATGSSTAAPGAGCTRTSLCAFVASQTQRSPMPRRSSTPASGWCAAAVAEGDTARLAVSAPKTARPARTPGSSDSTAPAAGSARRMAVRRHARPDTTRAAVGPTAARRGQRGRLPVTGQSAPTVRT